MSDGGTAEFLQQAYRNNWQQYLSSLQPGASGGWDFCVLTASDERQAEMYRRQVRARAEASLLPAGTRFQVVADPEGQRIGSGGATLRVLAGLSLQQRAAGRTLVIHSGGDSRRLPHCSAIGKLFARVPRALPDGRASTLFDEFLIALSGVAAHASPGALIASGDVLLVFDGLQLDLHRPGTTGVAIAAPAETGTHHGVYVTGPVEGLGALRLRAFLHKPLMARLREWEAVAADGTVGVDTGLVWFDGPTVARLVAMAEEGAVANCCGASGGRPAPGLNLYGDLLMPLVPTTERGAYLDDASDGPATPPLRAAREVIWERLRGVPLGVERLQPAVFAHFGTSREYWSLVTAPPDWARETGWTPHAAAWAATGAQGAVLLNAVLEGELAAGEEPGLIVDSVLSGPLSLGGAALIAGVESAQPLSLGGDVVVHQLPVQGGGWVTRVYGLDDDPKRGWEDGEATFVNGPWAGWLERMALDARDLWPGIPPAERTLWNARLYPLADDRQESLALALPLLDPAAAPPGWQGRWAASERLSLAEGFRRADGERILAGQAGVEDRAAACHFLDAVRDERPATEAAALLGRAGDAATRRAGHVAARLEGAGPLLQVRGYKALAEAADDGRWEDRAFAVLAGMIERDVMGRRAGKAATTNEGTGRAAQAATMNGAVADGRWADVERQHLAGPGWARVEAAARIDFGGGWTDTPPYSIERGGTVCNAAVTLHGSHPIVVEAERLDAPGLELCCADIDAAIRPTRLGEVLAYANPADPFALLKAAAVLRGIVPAEGDPAAPLEPAMAGGVRVRTRTTIPRGSGLGTSSILAGAVLACLARLQGVELSQTRLFDEVLLVEQMMTTGGGWQDQVGGLVGGIKLARSAPGLPQRVEVTPVRMAAAVEAELAQRLALVYTGQRRLAKNLLRAVMGRWMARDPEMARIQGEIARLALEMRDALEGGEVSRFGALLGEHWALNRRMDPGCTNPFLDGLFEAMGPHVEGGKLAGAGGGGFAIVVTRAADGGAVLGRALGTRYPGTQVGVWPCAIPAAGMVVACA